VLNIVLVTLMSAITVRFSDFTEDDEWKGSGSGSGGGSFTDDDDSYGEGSGYARPPVESEPEPPKQPLPPVHEPETPKVDIEPVHKGSGTSNADTGNNQTNAVDNGGASRQKMSLSRALTTYLVPIVVMWFGGVFNEIL